MKQMRLGAEKWPCSRKIAIVFGWSRCDAGILGLVGVAVPAVVAQLGRFRRVFNSKQRVLMITSG
jgi:hypothetical protein